ncbi:TonB-dependent receptor, partial [Dyadobacter sp.]|uniref:TonB-dependent receptor n=1 Tax=Dyadobacter sp. TaxID=1914288 RepID=UPI003F6F4697
MHKSHIRILAAALFLFIVAFRWADEDFTKTISEKLLRYRQAFPVEKAYLHTDKPYYMTGDTLWYNAFLVEGALHSPDSASNLLYVDLIDQRSGKNFALRRTYLTGGVGNGEIVLADSIPPGAYSLRAYTNWMRNAPDSFFFHKDIQVFDPAGTMPAPATGKVDLQFFPEGGALVAEIATRIAFKAVNASGKGEGVKGFIMDQNNDTVASFKSEHLGMGRFQFAAKSGASYTAFLKEKSGSVTKYEFPKVNETGYTLVVDNTSNPLKTRIIAYAKVPGKAEVPVNIVGHSRGIVAFVAKGKISSRGLMMNVPNTDLPDGITHLTLFDEENKPVSERLIFIDHNHSLRVRVAPSKAAYKQREQAEIEIAVSDTAGKPVQTHLSVSITDAGQIQQQIHDQNIVSYLLLSSDLRGFVEQPGYYFDETQTERKMHRDFLMMTQGWTRFKWDEVLRDSLEAPKYFLEQGITFAGEARRNKRPAEKTALSIYLSTDSLSNFLTAETDEKGQFALYNLIFEDSLKVRVQGMGKKGNQNLNFSIFPQEIPRISPSQNPYFPLT